MTILTEIQHKALAALRSGDYKQGSGYLHTRHRTIDGAVETRWCCLGVMADACFEDTVWLGPDGGGPMAMDRDGAPEAAFMLPHQAEALGIPGQVALTRANDQAGMFFEEIADLLETFWKYGDGSAHALAAMYAAKAGPRDSDAMAEIAVEMTVSPTKAEVLDVKPLTGAETPTSVTFSEL